MGLFFYTQKGSIISTVVLPTTEIIEPLFVYTQKGSIISTVDLPTTEIIEPFFLCIPFSISKYWGKLIWLVKVFLLNFIRFLL